VRALLDVNLLIALFDVDHVHHPRAWRWFEQHGGRGWATCPITQNGCLRVMSLPAYPNPVPVASMLPRLRDAVAAPEHAFWPDDTSLLDGRRFVSARIHGPRQLTDLYLLGLAVANGGRLATFDEGIPVSAVVGAEPKHLVVV
jgi:toxin-antitoxin system PIN domain toxin